MNDNSSTNEPQNKRLTEDQMDSLLRDFFRLEVPIELNQPLQFHPTAATTLTVATEFDHQPTHSRSVRFVAVAASVAAMAMAVVVAIFAATSPPPNGSTIANGLLNPHTETPEIDRPMLVSPHGDSQNSQKTVGDDGVTLEETDSIELHPQK
jgi:hypothetical protein